MNTFIGIGHIAKSATTRTVKVGNTPTQVTEFTVAVNEGYGETRQTDFIVCTIWRDRGVKLAPSLVKGREISVKGRITCRLSKTKDGKTWLDENGIGRASLVMSNPAIGFLDKRPGDPAVAPEEAEELPFEEDNVAY